MNGRRAFVVAIGAQLAFAGAFLIGGPMMHSARAQASPNEDQQWSCVDDGNRTCGPGNANGAPAGCYDDGGVLVAPWPCYVVVNADGSSDVYR